MRNWTRKWLDSAMAGADEIATSLATIAELEAGEFPGKSDAIRLFSQLPLLDLNESVAEVPLELLGETPKNG